MNEHNPPGRFLRITEEYLGGNPVFGYSISPLGQILHEVEHIREYPVLCLFMSTVHFRLKDSPAHFIEQIVDVHERKPDQFCCVHFQYGLVG